MAQTPALFFKDDGTVDYTPGSAVTAGDVVLIGTVVCVAPVDIPANTLGALHTEGIYKFPKTTDVVTAGDAIYWDVDGDPYGGTLGSGAADTAASTGNLIGWATAAAGATDTYVYVELNNSKRVATIGGSVTAADITAEDSSLGVNGIAAAQGGAIVVTGGTSSTENNVGGAVSLIGGVGTTTAVGGAARLIGGAGTGAAVGGAAIVTGGLGGSNAAGVGGAATVTAGAGQATAAGGIASVVGGASGAGATGNGGAVVLTGGAAASTNGSGGSVILTGGAKAGSGIAGGVFLRSGTGQIWFQQPVATAETDAANAIAAADMINGIVVHTVSQARALTTPTGAALLAVCPAAIAAGDAFYLHVITVGTGADDISTLTAGDGDITFVGNVTVGPDASTFNGYGTWIFRYTGGTAFVGYRVG